MSRPLWNHCLRFPIFSPDPQLFECCTRGMWHLFSNCEHGFLCNQDNTYVSGDQGHRREGGGGGSSSSSREVGGEEEEGSGWGQPTLCKYVNESSSFSGSFLIFVHSPLTCFPCPHARLVTHPQGPPQHHHANLSLPLSQSKGTSAVLCLQGFT